MYRGFEKIAPPGIRGNMLDYGFEVSEFERQLRYYVHFLTYTLEKEVKPLISPAFG